MSTFTKWFETFLEEKNAPIKSWEIESNGTTHFIDSDVVIEAIKTTSGQEQAQIKNTLVMIDFKNGDINHFFKHLAHGLVANY